MKPALLAAVVLSIAGCHETDHLGGRLPFRVAVQGEVPSQLTAGDVVRLEVSVLDGRGAPTLRGRVVQLRLVGAGGDSGGEGFLTPSRVEVPDGGAVTVDVIVQRAGRLRLWASAEGATPWLGARVQVASAGAAAVRYVRQPRDAWPADPQTVQIEVVDAFGNAVTDETHVINLDLGVEAPTIGGVASFYDLALPLGVAPLVAYAAGLEPATSRIVTVGTAVGGTLEYGRYPLKLDPAGGAAALDYDQLERLPIAGARVQLLSEGDVLAETVSEDDGGFRIAVPDDQPGLVLRVLAESTVPAVRVADNTAGGVTFAMEQAIDTSDLNHVITVYAQGGWSGDHYEERVAAPFALLDTVRRAAQLLTPHWQRTLPPLTLFWSEDNRPVGGDLSKGEIGTSHYLDASDGLYVLGAEDEDTDEYDVAVVVHEWGHYLFARGIGRSDTIGGTHGSGFVLDARTAYEEGICNTLAGVARLGGGRYYADTSGERQGSGWVEALDDNLGYDPLPGWYSEASVQAVFFDLYDSGGDSGEPWDGVGYGIDGVLDLLQDTVHSGGYATIFSLLEAARSRHPHDSDALDRLADKHFIAASDDGGWAANLPLFRPVPEGGGVVHLELEAAYTGSVADWGNQASANRWVTFVGDGRTWQVTVDSDHDVDVYLAQDGWPLLQTRTSNSNETLFVTTRPGAAYTANVRGWEKGAFTIEATLSARPQRLDKKLPPSWFATAPRARPSRAQATRAKDIRDGLRIMRARRL